MCLSLDKYIWNEVSEIVNVAGFQAASHSSPAEQSQTGRVRHTERLGDRGRGQVTAILTNSQNLSLKHEMGNFSIPFNSCAN